MNCISISNKEQTENETKETMPVKIASGGIKKIVNLTKEALLYTLKMPIIAERNFKRTR